MARSGQSVTSRRQVLKYSGASVAVSLSGCISGGAGNNNNSNSSNNSGSGNQQYTVPMGAGSSSGNTFKFCQAVSRVLSQESNNTQMSVQETDGWVSNAYLFDRGNMPAISLDNNTASLAANNKGQFKQKSVSNLPHQGITYTTLQIYWMATKGSGIESTDDFKGKNIYPIQPGFGTRLLTETLLKEAGMWDEVNVVNVNVDQLKGAISEGKVDAFATYGTNNQALVSWGQQVDVNNDVHAIKVGSDFENAIKNTGGANKVRIKPYGWKQDVNKVTDKITSWELSAQLRFGSKVPKQAVKNICTILNNNSETIKESDKNSLNYNKVNTITKGYLPDQPVHPGAASFLKSNGGWNKEWKTGESDN